MSATNLKSKIFKLLAAKDGITKDYAVQAWDINDGIRALARKLDIDEEDVRVSRDRYSFEELQKKHFANPFIRDYETVTREDLKNKRIIEKAQADLNALLRHEEPKKVSDGNLQVVRDISGNRSNTSEVRFRVFATTIGINKDGTPKLITNNKNYPREKENRPFKTDTNDLIYDKETTVILPNTDYIFPINVDGKTDADSLNSVFRFKNLVECYREVRNQIIDAGIADTPYRNNRNLTCLEACDSFLCGTGIRMGNREANPEIVAEFSASVLKRKEGNKLKYPKLKRAK